MTKKIIYLLPTIMMLENSGFAADAGIAALSTANHAYMALMLGSKGIKDARGTDFQLRQMIDGAITAGITDRLYGFNDRLSTFKAQVVALSGKKKLHLQLAYAFYALGYYESSNIEDLKNRALPLCGTIEPNFDREFMSLCALAYPGTIFAYKNSLEDVIKRTTRPLRLTDFVRPQGDGTLAAAAPLLPPPLPPVVQGDGAPQVERYYTDTELAGLDPAVTGTYKKLREREIPPKLARMPGQLPAKYEGDAVAGAVLLPPPLPPPPPPLPPVVQGDGAPQVERYYTDTELAGLEEGKGERYRIIKAQGKLPRAARIPVGLPPKYEAGGAPPFVVGAPQAAPGGLLAGIASADPLARLKKTQAAVPKAVPKPVVAVPKPAAAPNPMMLQLQQRIDQMTRSASTSSDEGDDWSDEKDNS